MSLKKIARADNGQALVETALVLGLLLFIIFVLIESARLFQANLTVQNAARQAGRYAITGDYDPSCLTEPTPCDDPRVYSIKQVAREAMAGLRLDDTAAEADPNYYHIEVFSVDQDGNYVVDSAGGPGDPVVVRVSYRVGIITPVVNAIARTVRVTGRVGFNNEQYNQYSNSSGGDAAPELPPLPTVGPSPTPVPPDLKIVKTDSPDPAIVGETLTYNFFVENLGQLTATGVTVTDTLPTGLTVTDWGPCKPAGSVVTCSLADLGPGSSTSFNLKVEPQSAGVITNTATVGGDQVDADPANNSSSQATEIADTPTRADLEVQKTASAERVAVGDTLVYEVVVINHGLASAENVRINDTLPGGVTFLTAVPDTGTCSQAGGIVTCEFGTLLRDGSTSATITVEPTAEGTITNTVTVESDTLEPSPNVAPNTDSVAVVVQNDADLGVTKYLSADPGIGDVITYTIAVVNNGPVAATDVVVTDYLPAEVQFVGYGNSTDQSRCDPPGTPITCPIGDLAVGASDSVQLLVRPTTEGLVENTVSVKGHELDWYSPNDSYTLKSEIRPRSDLEVVSIADSPDPVEAGSYLEYEIAIRNNGPSPAPGVRLADTLPANTTFISASASQGTCGYASGVVSCNLEGMATGATATVRIRIIPTQSTSGTITNSATVSGNETDPDPTNNTETETTNVQADTFITLEPICGAPGSEVTIKGFNWSVKKNEDLVLTWDPGTPAVEELLTFNFPVDTVVEGQSWWQTFTVPEGAALRQDHVVQAEIRGVVKEATFRVPCPAPDLEVPAAPQVITPTTVLAGEDVTFQVEIANSGERDAISQFFVGLYVDPAVSSSTHIPPRYRVGLQAVSSLAVGASRTLTFTVPAAFGVPGQHTVYAVVDSDPSPYGVITEELDERNNISPAATITVGDSPNPTEVPSVTPPPTATPANPGVIYGIVSIPAPGDIPIPQQNVEVTLIDEATGTSLRSTFTDADGAYYFTNVAPKPLEPAYTLTFCIDIDGVGYSDMVTGVTLPPGSTAAWYALLVEGLPCSS